MNKRAFVGLLAGASAMMVIVSGAMAQDPTPLVLTAAHRYCYA
jgi:hypothetical protein